MFDAAASHSNPASAPATTLDLALRLPADAYHHLVRTLRLTLPPPPVEAGATDGADDLRRRDHAAIARVAALAPANAAEADLAAQFVAASEQWKECLRLARQPETTPEWAHKCRAQANSMMRQANSALRLLLRMQALRRKQESDDENRDRFAWTEHVTATLMADALASSPQPPLAAEGEGAPTSPLSPGAEQGNGEAADAAKLIAAAERYAACYPERAARIRRTGRLPNDVVFFDPPEAALARALITGRTLALSALDELPADAPDVTRGHRIPGWSSVAVA